MTRPLTVAILAGGNSRRFGHDKGLAALHGRPMVAHVLDRVAGLGSETLVVTNRPEDYNQFGQPLVRDVLPGRGVLGGLYTALHHASQPWVLCLACDMPLVNRALLEYLWTLTADADAVVPCLGGQAEPLHALWSRACLGPIREALERGDRRLISFFPAIRVRAVAEPEIDNFDPEHAGFLNANTPAELAAIAQRPGAMRHSP
jgi:molybdenum cofactor guanylyltransferase